MLILITASINCSRRSRQFSDDLSSSLRAAMKGCVVFLALFTLAACNWSAEEKKIFREWRKMHNKHYKSHAEELAALEKFMKNYNEIEEHNALFADGVVTYKRKLWEFSDFSHEEKRKFLHGVHVPSDHKHSRNSRSDAHPHFPVGPKSIDWVEKELVGPVENQGACGSCWAFSTAALIEAVFRKKHRNKAMVSPQQLVDCSHTGTNGCSGGWPEYALDYVKIHGIADEEDYPYDGYQRTCEFTPNEKVGTITGVHNIPTRGNETWLR
jgi:C1A family cysteine protease